MIMEKQVSFQGATMEKQQSFRNGAMEKQMSFTGIMEKQKSFRIAMERQMSFGGGERKRGKDSPGKRGDSPLHLAARAGNLDKNGNSLVVSEFLKHLDLKIASIMANNGFNVLERTLFTVLSILKSESFSRDCLVAAEVTFCVALQGILIVVSRTVLHIEFVVSNDNFGSIMDSGDSRKSIKMTLYNVILPKLCNFCENSIDSHFSFHALMVMQIYLHQVKTSMLNKNGSVDVNYDPISEDMGTRLLQKVWNNLEDPLSQTVKQVHLIFYLLLDIQARLLMETEQRSS
ncbi:hypothetical protein CQW23_11236 [Capsicum baccatum]|uniref:Uncharacterized protein n=1 Tax=Capsicum baccatum TaxID=33114 RepID=A0A2G2WP51_CAPBA|nr:hypothetical protein CQW23_11236 [Capsicum baccatum]